MAQKVALRAQFDAANAPRRSPLPADPVIDWTAWRYRPVIAAGTFDAARQILIDNKMQDGRAGYHVVTPLDARDGRAVLVDRGWVAAGATRAQLPAAAPPAGTVSVHRARQHPTTATSSCRRDVPAGGVWQNLDPARVRQGHRRRACCPSCSSRRRRWAPATTWCAPGRRRISASSAIGSTWCSGISSPRPRRGTVAVVQRAPSTRGVTEMNEPAASPPAPGTRAKGRRTLLLLALVAVAPVVASYTAYYLLPRDKTDELRRAAADAFPRPISRACALTAGRSRSRNCAASGCCCRARLVNAMRRVAQALYATRQARTIQGREMDRVQRVWLVTRRGAPDPALLAEHPDLVVARVPARRARQPAPPAPTASISSIRWATSCWPFRATPTSSGRPRTSTAC